MISDKGKKGENRILQVNVDQIDYGGVYALVMAMYKELRKHSDIQFDFCAFEKFQNTEEIKNYVNEITRASREDFLNIEIKSGEQNRQKY